MVMWDLARKVSVIRMKYSYCFMTPNETLTLICRNALESNKTKLLNNNIE